MFLKIGPLEENFCYIVKALTVKIKGLQQTPNSVRLLTRILSIDWSNQHF